MEGVESTPLSQYLSLVRLSDQALEKLISYFEEADEKTIVVFFVVIPFRFKIGAATVSFG